MDLVEEVRKKREFSGLPDSIIERALEISEDDVKVARAFLRKYFGVFLTNKVLKGKGVEVLKSHRSSVGRDYEKFYGRIFGDEIFNSVIDLGCGVNGFSYGFLPSGIRYVGVEASGQLVDGMNSFFEEKGFDGRAVRLDLFDKDSVLKIVREAKSPRVVFMFQVIDALEGFSRNYSKELLLSLRDVLKKEDMVVVSFRIEGLSGGGMFAKRKWLIDFLREEFRIEEDLEMDGERILRVSKKL